MKYLYLLIPTTFLVAFVQCSTTTEYTMDDAYRILGVRRTATKEQIKKKYKELALKWHPDRNPDNREEATRKFKEINAAKNMLLDHREADASSRGSSGSYGQSFSSQQAYFSIFQEKKLNKIPSTGNSKLDQDIQNMWKKIINIVPWTDHRKLHAFFEDTIQTVLKLELMRNRKKAFLLYNQTSQVDTELLEKLFEDTYGGLHEQTEKIIDTTTYTASTMPFFKSTLEEFHGIVIDLEKKFREEKSRISKKQDNNLSKYIMSALVLFLFGFMLYFSNKNSVKNKDNGSSKRVQY